MNGAAPVPPAITNPTSTLRTITIGAIQYALWALMNFQNSLMNPDRLFILRLT